MSCLYFPSSNSDWCLFTMQNVHRKWVKSVRAAATTVAAYNDNSKNRQEEEKEVNRHTPHVWLVPPPKKKNFSAVVAPMPKILQNYAALYSTNHESFRCRHRSIVDSGVKCTHYTRRQCYSLRRLFIASWVELAANGLHAAEADRHGGARKMLLLLRSHQRRRLTAITGMCQDGVNQTHFSTSPV